MFAAVFVDVAAFTSDISLIRWLNYAFVWLAVFQLGVAWRHSGQTGALKALWWIAVLAIVLLILAILFGGVEQKAKRGVIQTIPVWQAIVAALLLCNGLALVALTGFGAEVSFGQQLFALLLVILGVRLLKSEKQQEKY